ncbi:MAG: prolyl oligopeptidase family serine peptidase [Flavobacteriales bacterium]
MNKFFPIAVIFLMNSCLSVENKEASSLQYPQTKKVDSVNHFFGKPIADPYAWLEQEESDDVKQWVAAQRKITEEYLSGIANRNQVKSRMQEIWNFEKRSAPFKRGDYHYYYKNDGVQNQSVVYRFKDDAQKSEVFIDPNTLSTDGTVSMGGLSFSKDSKWVAYPVSRLGSDWQEIITMNVETGEVLKDTLKWVKFSGISWLENGFFYSRYPVPEGNTYTGSNEFHAVYYHKAGTAQSADKLIYKDDKNPKHNVAVYTSYDEDYVFLSVSQGTSGNKLMFSESKLIKEALGCEAVNCLFSFRVVYNDFDADRRIVDVVDNQFYIYTNQDAPNYKVQIFDTKKYLENAFRDFISEQEGVLQSFVRLKERYLLKYLENVKTHLYSISLTNSDRIEITAPGIGVVSSISSERNRDDFYYSFVSFTQPNVIYYVNENQKDQELYFAPKLSFNPANYETKQVWFSSKDGTKVPMFITHKKGLQLNGNLPTFVFGYGGFNISYLPEFRADRIAFIEAGGVYCVPNIRGGGEFGKNWHQSGIKLQKQNVFDDFIAACEYLIKEGYTNPDKLAVHGRSNGGLLIGAVMTQRPDLFKVAIPQVGVLDMLKYHQFTIGWAWAGDYGRSDDSEEMFNYLLSYSPIHNVKSNMSYPATLVVTGDYDDRVVPVHSYKFIAELQEKQQGTNPILIRIDQGAGHGSGKPVAKEIDEYSDIWAFVMHNLGMK